jgi:hypothetical protein
LTMRVSRVCVIAIASILAFGCDLTESLVTSLSPQPPASGKGILVLTLRSGTLRGKTLEPPVSMEIASFDIRGTGPDPVNDHFEDLGNTAGLLLLNGLNPGLWTITVDARNTAGTIIGNGQTNPPVLITAGAITNTQIDIAPVGGTGVLQLTVQWAEGAHPNAAAECSLVSMSTGLDLTPTIVFTPSANPEMATYSNTTIEAGYYLLLLRLYDNGAQLWGIAEAVRIVAGETTSQIWTTN